MDNSFYESKEYRNMAIRYYDDKEHNGNKWIKITETIKDKYTCFDYLYKFLTMDILSYADIIYKLKWPSELDKEHFENARYEDGKSIKPIILRGRIIDNEKLDNGQTRLTLIGLDEPFDERDKAKRLLHLQKVKSLEYHIIALDMIKGRKHTIGNLDEVKPGIEVIIALASLELCGENGIIAYFTDIIPNCYIDSDAVYLDKNYLFKKEKDLIVEYSKYLQKNEPTENTQAEGCYIATAVYSSYDCPEVWTLRRFRDDFLRKTYIGSIFVKIYYIISPILVKYFSKEKWFIVFWKNILDKLVFMLQKKGYDSSPYKDK